jgi:hypothetical protein
MNPKNMINKFSSGPTVNYFLLLLITLLASSSLTAQNPKVAQNPPMGWNSYNSFGASVKESEVLENAGFMASHLKSFGWQYIVIGYCWYYPYPAALSDPAQAENFTPWLSMDEYGRLLPDIERFPSSKKGKGFKPLADELHRKGLKFGIHIMRGIPRQAVASNSRIKGTKFRAKDIADTTSTCKWLNHMYGLDMDKPGAQEYYNSLFELYARWGVDFVIADDISSPISEKEIIAIRKAIDHCGKPMVLSLSPGETPLTKADFVKEYADSWRVSTDFWDKWESVEQMFTLLHSWEKHIGTGHFPDADMLAMGQLSQRGPKGEPRQSQLNRHELLSMMTLWSIARSPLMYGGDLSLIRPYELSLLQNKAVIGINQNSINNRQLLRHDDYVVWTADVPGSPDKYLAIFNLGENKKAIHFDLNELGYNGEITMTDLWMGDYLGQYRSAIKPEVPAHGVRLFRLSE